MDVILSSVKWQFDLVYQDDNVIFSTVCEHHIDHVGNGLTLLKNAGVIPKLKKCRFITEAVDYMVRVIRPRSLKIASHTTHPIPGLRAPTNITELRSFLGMCMSVDNWSKTLQNLKQRRTRICETTNQRRSVL